MNGQDDWLDELSEEVEGMAGQMDGCMGKIAFFLGACVHACMYMLCVCMHAWMCAFMCAIGSMTACMN